MHFSASAIFLLLDLLIPTIVVVLPLGAQARKMPEARDANIVKSLSRLAAAAGPSSGTTNTTKKGKSSNDTMSIGVCSKRLEILVTEMESHNFTQSPFDECTLYEPFGTNWMCPSFWYPGLGFADGDLEWYINNPENLTYPEYLQESEMFCECYMGHNWGCAHKIPLSQEDAGEKWADYCKFVAIWNGDANVADVELSSEIEECGCYFISVMKEKVDLCPGVKLGEFFFP